MVDQITKLPEMKTDEKYLKIKTIRLTIITVNENNKNLINKKNQAKYTWLN